MNTAELLEVSRERDVQLSLRLAAYREGWSAGARQQWDLGYVAAIESVKRMEQEVTAAVALAGRRLDPGGEAWLAAVARNGGTEYGGRGRPRVPVDLALIEMATNTVKGRSA